MSSVETCVDVPESHDQKRRNNKDIQTIHNEETVHDNHDNDSDGDGDIDNKNTKTFRRNSSVWNVVKRKLSISQKGATPLDWKLIFLVTISLFASAISIAFLFPFLPEMVLYFGYEEQEKGYYAGIIGSSLFAGRAFGSYFWGWLSDKVGRRPVMLITLFGNGFFSFLFGFTINVPMAFAMRFLTGLANGTVGTAKTVLYEICDNTNQAVGMTMMAVAWGGGIVLGPTLGGILASPAKNYPNVFSPDGLFGKFPYLLPSLVIFAICCVVMTIDFFFLPETLETLKKKKENDITEDETEPLKNGNTEGLFDQKLPFNYRHDVYGQYSVESLPAKIALSVEDLHCESEAGTYKVQKQILMQRLRNGANATKNKQNNSAILDVKKASSHFDISRNFDNNIDEAGRTRAYSESYKTPNCADLQILDTEIDVKEKDEAQPKEDNSTSWCFKWLRKVKNTSLGTLLGSADIRSAVTLYASFSFGVIGYEEIFTIWASTENRLDGLGYDPSRIGTILGLSSIPIMFLNVYIFPFLVSKLTLKRTFILCSVFQMISITVMPIIHLMPDKSDTTVMILVLLCDIPERIFAACGFSASSLFVNNSSPPGKTGAVNGIAMSVTAITRSIAPAIGGSVFAWSVSYGSPVLGPPFDVNLSFFLFGFFIWINGIYAVYLNEDLNSQTKK